MTVRSRGDGRMDAQMDMLALLDAWGASAIPRKSEFSGELTPEIWEYLRFKLFHSNVIHREQIFPRRLTRGILE